MKPPSDVAFSALQRSLLHVAAFVVPTAIRQEWRSEWFAELWHVRHSLVRVDDSFSPESEREILWFCLGAFPDALCLRTQSPKGSAQPVHMHGSAGQTLLWLSAIMMLCFLIAQLLPGIQAENEASHLQIRPGVLIISEAAAIGTKPTIPTGLFRDWNTTRQRFFEDLAFYRVSHETAHSGAARISWNVAHSTSNVFALLGLPLKQTADSDDSGSTLPALVLSHEAWMRSFAGDPHVAGRTLRVGNISVRIAGVIPAVAWKLPGSPDAWLLQSGSQVASAVPPQTTGYLLAQLSARGQAAIDGPDATIAARNFDDLEFDLAGTPIYAPVEGPWNIYEFGLFLALLALPAVTSVSLGETHITSHRPSKKECIRRCLFLAGKFALIAGIALYASLDMAYWYTSSFSPIAECLQLFSCFAVALAGFRWALADQRHRCPVCLRRVTNPASVGLASRTFLGWNGTELICMGGHTLLHVPSLPTSWFSDQRWLYLDSSWQFLFADPGVY